MHDWNQILGRYHYHRYIQLLTRMNFRKKIAENMCVNLPFVGLQSMIHVRRRWLANILCQYKACGMPVLYIPSSIAFNNISFNIHEACEIEPYVYLILMCSSVNSKWMACYLDHYGCMGNFKCLVYCILLKRAFINEISDCFQREIKNCKSLFWKYCIIR